MEKHHPNFRIALCIACHKSTPVFTYLIDKLQHPNIDLYVHIDGKVDIEPFSDLMSSVKAVFITERHKIRWGRFSQIKYMLSLFAATRQRKVDYIALISGDSLPLYSAEEIIDRFASIADIESLPYEPAYPQHKLQRRLRRYRPWYRKLGEIFADMLHIKSYKIERLGYGSNWIGFTPQFRDWVFDYLEKNPQYAEAFHGSRCGDELFFQTLAIMSPFAERITRNPSFMYADWRNGGCHPKMLDESDFTELLSLRKERAHLLFARKFSDTTDIKIHERLFLSNK